MFLLREDESLLAAGHLIQSASRRNDFIIWDDATLTGITGGIKRRGGSFIYFLRLR